MIAVTLFASHDSGEFWRVIGLSSIQHNHAIQRLDGVTEIERGISVRASRANLIAMLRIIGKEKFHLDSSLARYLPQPFDLRGELPDIPITHTDAWRHQKQAFWYAQERVGTILGMRMGTGKTKVVLDLARNTDAHACVIICPQKAVNNWPREILKHYGNDAMICAINKKFTVKERAKQVSDAMLIANQSKRTLFVILNYECAWRDPMATLLLSVKWDFAVVDESHRISDVSTQIGKFCMKLRDVSAKRLALSGTPYKQTPIDIFGQASFVDPSVFGAKFFFFKQKWAKIDSWSGKIIGVNDEAAFEREVARIMFSCGDDVLDLPSAMHVQRFVQLSETAQKIYENLETEFDAEIDQGTISVANGAVRVLRLQQATSGYAKTSDGAEHEIDDAKKEGLGEIFDELDIEEPIVVFARFTHDIESIISAAHAAGRTCAIVDGKRDHLDTWQSGRANVLAVQIDAGGEAIDLTRARYQVYFSIGHSLAKYDQSQKRIHRPGQTEHVTYYHLIAQNTIDEDVYDAIKHGQNIIEALLQRNRTRHIAA